MQVVLVILIVKEHYFRFLRNFTEKGNERAILLVEKIARENYLNV